MYTDGLSFLEDERDAWRPFEILSQLTDDELERPVEGDHGWWGRDRMAHLLSGQLVALDVAKELAIGPTSPSHERADAEWKARGGDVNNTQEAPAWRPTSIH